MKCGLQEKTFQVVTRTLVAGGIVIAALAAPVQAFTTAGSNSRLWLRRLRAPERILDRPAALGLIGRRAGQIPVSELGDGTTEHEHQLVIHLGGQALRVVPDTGSFELVVSSTRCAQDQCPRRKFDHSSSKTYEACGDAKQMTYLSGSVSALEACDKLQLFGGGAAKAQRFSEITGMGASMRGLWDKAQWDGVLGLSWRSTLPGELGASANATTVLENFGVQTFSFCLGRRRISPSGSHFPPSFIYWGPAGWQSQSFADVASDMYWAVALGEAAAVARDVGRAGGGGDTPQPLPVGEGLALMDTGAGFISMPSRSYTELVGELRDDCSNFEAMPDLRFRLGDGVSVSMRREAFISRQTLGYGNNTWEFCMPLVKPTVTSLDGAPLWILGVPFFQAFVVEFDRSQRPARVGISPHPGASNVAGGGGECPPEPPLAAATAALPAVASRGTGERGPAFRRAAFLSLVPGQTERASRTSSAVEAPAPRPFPAPPPHGGGAGPSLPPPDALTVLGLGGLLQDVLSTGHAAPFASVSAA